MEADDLEERMKQLQAANETKQRQLEDMRKVADVHSALQGVLLDGEGMNGMQGGNPERW